MEIRLADSLNSCGEVIYKGPFLRIPPIGDRIEDYEFIPHETGVIALADWMVDEDGNWLPRDEAQDSPTASYTVEIEWKARLGTNALMS